MASAKAKIRHVFGDTFSCRAAPPDILVELSGGNIGTDRFPFRGGRRYLRGAQLGGACEGKEALGSVVNMG